jgi:hypothetical protein
MARPVFPIWQWFCARSASAKIRALVDREFVGHEGALKGHLIQRNDPLASMTR